MPNIKNIMLSTRATKVLDWLFDVEPYGQCEPKVHKPADFVNVSYRQLLTVPDCGFVTVKEIVDWLAVDGVILFGSPVKKVSSIERQIADAVDWLRKHGYQVSKTL